MVQKARAHGVKVDGLREELSHLGVEVVAFTTAEAEAAADLWHGGMRALSLADRACLATAIVRRLPVVTADRAWAGLALEVAVKVIR